LAADWYSGKPIGVYGSNLGQVTGYRELSYFVLFLTLSRTMELYSEIGHDKPPSEFLPTHDYFLNSFDATQLRRQKT